MHPYHTCIHLQIHETSERIYGGKGKEEMIYERDNPKERGKPGPDKDNMHRKRRERKTKRNQNRCREEDELAVTIIGLPV